MWKNCGKLKIDLFLNATAWFKKLSIGKIAILPGGGYNISPPQQIVKSGSNCALW
jgi:hypothetical protein